MNRAAVYVGTYRYPNGNFEGFAKFETDADGIATISRRTEVGMLMPTPNGPFDLGFRLCITKPGFTPAMVRRFGKQVAVVLEPTAIDLKCEW